MKTSVLSSSICNDLDLLFPPLREKVLLVVDQYNFEEPLKPVFIFETYRSHTRQHNIWLRGRRVPGKQVTDMPSGNSFHQYGLAVDLVFGGPGRWTWEGPWHKLGLIGERHGLTWGGRWSKPDKAHLQMDFGLTIKQIRQMASTEDRILGLWRKLILSGKEEE